MYYTKSTLHSRGLPGCMGREVTRRLLWTHCMKCMGKTSLEMLHVTILVSEFKQKANKCKIPTTNPQLEQ